MAAFALRGTLFYFDTKATVEKPLYHWIEDGILWVDEGKIIACGEASLYLDSLRQNAIPLEDYRGKIISPGFIDMHTHYVQYHAMASFGEQLLPWLNKYIFPEEENFASHTYAEKMAEVFLKALFRHGTTTAVVLATAYPESVNAFFKKAAQANARMFTGQLMMDRFVPAALARSPGQYRDENQQLIEAWHQHKRLQYILSLRFAATASEGLMQTTQQLREAHPTLLFQTHYAENEDECRWIQSLFPSHDHYLSVYDHYGLLGPKTLLAHGIYVSPQELARLAATQTQVVHCPNANLMLGSGLFQSKQYREAGVSFTLGTDIGAGNDLSLFSMMRHAYQVAHLQAHLLSPALLWYLATLHAAKALAIDKVVGNFQVGQEADLIIINPANNPYLRDTWHQRATQEEKLFALIALGDDRLIDATYVFGKKVSDDR